MCLTHHKCAQIVQVSPKNGQGSCGGVVTLTRRLFKLACRSLIKRHVPRISTPRMLRADGSGW